MGIALREYEKMQTRVRSGKGGVRPESVTAAPRQTVEAVVLGIDPSLRGTGYGVIRKIRSELRVLAQGTIRCPSGWERSRCLVEIARAIRRVVGECKPTVCVVEGLFYAQNLKTALIMGEARGAALVAAAEGDLPVYEIAPRKVKQAIVGYGGAQKLAVAKMVQRILALPELPASDAADALALALAHLQENNRYPLTTPRRI